MASHPETPAAQQKLVRFAFAVRPSLLKDFRNIPPAMVDVMVTAMAQLMLRMRTADDADPEAAYEEFLLELKRLEDHVRAANEDPT